MWHLVLRSGAIASDLACFPRLQHSLRQTPPRPYLAFLLGVELAGVCYIYSTTTAAVSFLDPVSITRWQVPCVVTNSLPRIRKGAGPRTCRID